MLKKDDISVIWNNTPEGLECTAGVKIVARKRFANTELYSVNAEDKKNIMNETADKLRKEIWDRLYSDG